MNLPDEIPAHQLLTADLARELYDQLAGLADTAVETRDHRTIVASITETSERIQQAVVDFVQAEIERTAKNGRPFRLVARCT
jgi:hypothetical protein